LDVRLIREVVPRVLLQRVAFGPAWLTGVFIYRGQVVPVIDLHRLIGAEDCPLHLSTRIILVNHLLDGEERLLGLQAAQVADIREMQPPSQAPDRLTSPGQPDLGPVLVDGREIVHLVELDRLLPESYQRHLALVPKALTHEPDPRDRHAAGADWARP
jgi:chemotaxis-related protein WspB